MKSIVKHRSLPLFDCSSVFGRRRNFSVCGEDSQAPVRHFGKTFPAQLKQQSQHKKNPSNTTLTYPEIGSRAVSERLLCVRLHAVLQILAT